MSTTDTTSACDANIAIEQSRPCQSESSAIQRTLSKSGMVHLRNFATTEEIHEIRLEIDRLFDSFAGLPPALSPKTDNSNQGEIREIAHLVKNYPTFRHSAVYRKCHLLANQIFAPVSYTHLTLPTNREV